MKLLGSVLQEAGFIINEDYFNTERPYTDFLILEAFGQLLDATTFGPDAAAPLCAAAAVDLLAYLKWLNEGQSQVLPPIPENWRILRAFSVSTEGGDFTVLARTAWMAEEAISYLDLTNTPRAGDPAELSGPDERERWGDNVKIVKIILGSASRPSEHVVYNAVETISYETLFDQSRWIYDFENDTLVLAVVLGVPTKV